jgi:hypothetical protein
MKKLLLGILAAGVLCFLAAPASAQCPAAGAATGCNVTITINPGGSLSFSSVSGTLIDALRNPGASDDVMVGIINNSGVSITSLTLTGTSNIFGFDGDGACAGYTLPNASPCTPTFNEYFPAGITDSGVAVDQKSGKINFTGNLAPGAQTWISLENFSGVSGTAAATPEPGTLGLVGSSLLGLAGILRRRRVPSSR